MTEPTVEPTQNTHTGTGSDANETGITHVLIGVDDSGSMYRLRDDVRGGFNQFLDEQAAQPNAGRIRVTAVLFASTVRLLCIGARVGNVPRLDRENYVPAGNTALYDAVGTLIDSFEAENTLADGDRVLLVVQTDGRENSSREYVATDIQQKIADRERTGRWVTVYLGAGPSAWFGGEALGMRSVNTTADPQGTRSVYGAVSQAATTYSSGVGAAETFSVLETAAGDGSSSVGIGGPAVRQ